MQPMEPREIDVSTVHDMRRAPGSGGSRSRAFTSCSLPSEMWIKLGILPRRSSRVCIFTADLVVRKCAQGNTDRHRSMVVESKA